VQAFFALDMRVWKNRWNTPQALRICARYGEWGFDKEATMTGCDVLVVGAVPTGLVLALWLSKLGARVRVVDKTGEPGTTSRALAIQARTLELCRQLDLDDAVVERARKVPAVNLWARGRKAARISFEEVGVGLSPYPSLRIFPQDEHERLLIDRLAAMGGSVERRTELVGFRDEGDRVVAELRHADKGDETVEATYIAGCDGARSFVRENDRRRISGRNLSPTLLRRRRCGVRHPH